MDCEPADPDRSPVLTLSDSELLKEIFSALSKSINSLANPYSDDGSFAAAIAHLPLGLRAMAATHHLDISLTLDDIGWHFRNFSEPNFVRETESGLHELGLSDMADWFAEARTIITPLQGEIDACGDYYECLTKHGQMDRINQLTLMTRNKQPTLSGSPIYSAWVKYTRLHPEHVFENQTF